MNNAGITFAPGPTPNAVRSSDGKVLTAPEDWVFLPPGDAALTRRVKEAGDHWVIAEKKGRKIFWRGVWASAATIVRIRDVYVEVFHGVDVAFLDIPRDDAPIKLKKAHRKPNPDAPRSVHECPVERLNPDTLSLMMRLLFTAIALLLVAAEPASRLRVIIETDAGGDPDDEQSLVRWLLYANEWDVEGIVCNRPKCRDRENLNSERTGHGVVLQLIKAYEACHPMLVKHDAHFPAAESLRKVCVKGYADTDVAVKLLIAAVDKVDSRPIWYSDWGTDQGASENNMKRTLDRIRKERGPEEYAKFKSKLRMVTSDQFKDHTTTVDPPFKLLVESSRPEIDRQRWYHRFSPLTAKAGGFDLKRDVLRGHGPLGELYPTNTTLPQKEGDTLYFLHLIPNGLSDPEQPTWGGWGGRLGKNENYKNRPYFWANVQDSWRGTTSRDNVLARWAVDLQNDFRARLEWCVKPLRDANHNPVAIVNGSSGRDIIHRVAAPGEEVKLSAVKSSDPDGDALTYEWFVYPEPGSYRGEVKLAGSDNSEVSLLVPSDADGKTIHLVLAIRDQGHPALAAYRRCVLTCRSK